MEAPAAAPQVSKRIAQLAKKGKQLALLGGGLSVVTVIALAGRHAGRDVLADPRGVCLVPGRPAGPAARPVRAGRGPGACCWTASAASAGRGASGAIWP